MTSWQKSPPPQDEGKFFDFGSINFRQFWASYGFCGRKGPLPRMRENFLTLDLSISRWFLSNFAFCGRKGPPTSRTEGNFLHLWIYHISGDFEQLWFLWQKSPPPWVREIFLTLDLSISGVFEQFWFFVAEKHPPPSMRENFLTLDLSISGDFEQVMLFVAEKPPTPTPAWGKIFWLWIYPFQVILSKFGFCGRKAPLPAWGKIFWLWIYPFQAILSKFGFCGRKAPPNQDEGKFFDFGSIYFRWFWATLVFVAEKPPLPGWGKIFWLWIYPFQVILSKFGFWWQKSTPSPGWGKNFLTLDLSISGDFEQVWLFVVETPTPRMRENYLTLDLSISGDFEQVWFLWQKGAPPSFLPFGEILSSCCSTWCNFTDWYFMHHWISHW